VARHQWQNEPWQHWVTSGLVLCGLAAAVGGQLYLDRIRPPYNPPPILNDTKSNAPGLLEQTARAAAVAEAYNRASDAARTDNRVVLAEALEDLRQLRSASRAAPLALAAAENAVLEASEFQTQARAQKGSAAGVLEAKAAMRYREALSLSPRFNSKDPELVNALGYFLADKGTTLSDFQQAERLTRQAMATWDKIVGDKEANDPVLARDMLSRANTRDSLAWALFRLKRYDEALREQQQAIIEASISSKALEKELSQKIPMSEEMHFHLGEIYRALKRWEDARAEYRRALELKPDDANTLKAMKLLPPAILGKPAPAPRSPAHRLPIPKVPAPEELEPDVPDYDLPDPDTRAVPRARLLPTRL